MTTESRVYRVYDVAMLIDMIHQTPGTAARRRAAYRTMKRRLFKLDTIARRRARRAARKEARAMLYPDAECQRCADRGTVPSNFGPVRCECTIGQTVDFIPERTHAEHRQTAYDWHGGQGSALYQWASTNGDHANYSGLVRELDRSIAWCLDNPATDEAEDLDNLRSLLRYLAHTLAPEVDYDEVPF